ncbi:CgeB family protein [Microbaculum marinum]|uniref:Glycosyltransferase n=1 Tax=Microbaculum marinum TaxID=1764581 RepID=A0AAW9RKX8_9HYPH
MRFVFYTHSLVSDWNHGNAHFLRGVMRDLIRRGHSATALEPSGGWSRTNLLIDQGHDGLENFEAAFPDLHSEVYGENFDHAAVLDGADVVIVHEWTDPQLVADIGRIRRDGGRFKLLFHDTHHRAVSAEGEIASLFLDDYDAILVFGDALRERYQRAGSTPPAHVWHEAADVELFRPLPNDRLDGDVIWIGNWGDGERAEELREYLIDPVRHLNLRGTVRGVRYPGKALEALNGAGFHYGGWIANAEVPRAFSRHRATIHVPRRPYVEALPGIPTIRVFEALACGIPLISAPWNDCEGLFRPGRDFLLAHNGDEMVHLLHDVLHDEALRSSMITAGLETIRTRHTCSHRVEELLSIVRALRLPDRPADHRLQIEAAQ